MPVRTGIPEYGERLLKVSATRRVFDPKHPGELVAGEPLFEELLSCVALGPAGFELRQGALPVTLQLVQQARPEEKAEAKFLAAPFQLGDRALRLFQECRPRRGIL